jgi:hypothetical protein
MLSYFQNNFSPNSATPGSVIHSSEPVRSSTLPSRGRHKWAMQDIPRLASLAMIFSVASLVENMVAEVEFSKVNASALHLDHSIQR